MGRARAIDTSAALVRYDAARTALSQALRLDEVKDAADKAEAIRVYARMAGDYALEADAAELRQRAERRLGELLSDARAAGQFGDGRPKNRPGGGQFSKIKLEDLGISRNLSSRAQRLAGIRTSDFDTMLARMRGDIIAGRRAGDILKGAAQEVLKERRRDLQRTLSDESARLATPGGRKFPVIYADPATKFLAGASNRSTENHYRTMTVDELVAMGPQVQARCLPDAQAFVWSTVPQLAMTILRILPAWGFAYSSSCVWDKTSPDMPNEQGTGFVFRNQHEILLYCVRGNPPGPKVKPLSIYRERKAREHSRKPDAFRTIITEMTGGLPVLELFARVDADHPLPQGWEAWGNEAEPAVEQTNNKTSCPTDSGSMAGAEASSAAASAPRSPAPSSKLEIPAFLRRGPEERAHG